MQVFKVFALVTAGFASTASAKCFNRGQNWGNHDDAKAALNDACNVIQGNFGPGQIKNECVDAKDFRSFKFEIQNNGKDHDVSISHGACFKTISREIDHCGHGGEETFNNIRYRGDPNKGAC